MIPLFFQEFVKEKVREAKKANREVLLVIFVVDRGTAHIMLFLIF